MPKRIIFMGTPDFAVESLRKLIESGVEIAAVVTAPDKPAGRGKKVKSPPVKDYAVSQDITVLQPLKLKDQDFISRLKSYNADIFVVVAFRMLPKAVWEIPPLGTFNLHASLLPQYRGAAPINWAIINGEDETGLTTFLIDEQIDTGRIIIQEKVGIDNDMNAGQLHDILMVKGADLVLETVRILSEGKTSFINQSEFITNNKELKAAPRINKDDCRIDWSLSSRSVYNFIRGLSPYPGAWTIFETEEKRQVFSKVLEAQVVTIQKRETAGKVSVDDKYGIIVFTGDGAIMINKIQHEGKRTMRSADFLRGFRDILTRAL